MVRTYRVRDLTANPQAKVDLRIPDASGRSRYRLLCHSGNYEGTADLQYPGEQHDFVGDFDCHLHSLESPGPSLLIHDPLDSSRPSRARSILLARDATGNCASYPEYGLQREFRLRGMRISFRYSNVEFASSRVEKGIPGIASFDFQVEVKPDRDSISAIAEQVDVDRPVPSWDGTANCDEIVRRHVLGRITKEYVSSNSLGAPFPEIRSMDRIFHLDSKIHDFQVPIMTPEGRVAYRFQCTTNTRWGISCELKSEGGKINLLEDSVDPYSGFPRSIISPEQLFGQCQHYPDWGSRRTFRLRHMSIDLEIDDPRFTTGGTDWMRVSVPSGGFMPPADSKNMWWDKLAATGRASVGNPAWRGKLAATGPVELPVRGLVQTRSNQPGGPLWYPNRYWQGSWLWEPRKRKRCLS